MEPPAKILEQIAYNTRGEIEEHIMIVMDESTHEEHLSEPLQTNNKHFKITVTLLTGYNGSFNVRDKNNNFYFAKPNIDRNGLIHITIPRGACKIESLSEENRRINSEEGHFTQLDYPFTIEPNISTLDSIIQISRHEPLISFLPDDCIRNPFELNLSTIYKEYNLSPQAIDFLLFDILSLECDNARGMIFRGKWSGILHNFTMDVDPGYKYVEKFRGNVQSSMMESKEFISSISFKIKNEKEISVSFKVQSITFRLSIKEV